VLAHKSASAIAAARTFVTFVLSLLGHFFVASTLTSGRLMLNERYKYSSGHIRFLLYYLLSFCNTCIVQPDSFKSYATVWFFVRVKPPIIAINSTHAAQCAPRLQSNATPYNAAIPGKQATRYMYVSLLRTQSMFRTTCADCALLFSSSALLFASPARAGARVSLSTICFCRPAGHRRLLQWYKPAHR
jgi:hypothetical protein